MFIKLTLARNGDKILVNADCIAAVVPNAIGRSQIGWKDPDLQVMVVKETVDEIHERLARGHRE